MNRNVTAVPCRAGGTVKDEHTRSVIELDGIMNRPDPKMLTPERNTGAVAGVKVTPALIDGGGGDTEPPAGDPPALSAEPSVKVPTVVTNSARKKFSKPLESSRPPRNPALQGGEERRCSRQGAQRSHPKVCGNPGLQAAATRK